MECGQWPGLCCRRCGMLDDSIGYLPPRPKFLKKSKKDLKSDSASVKYGCFDIMVGVAQLVEPQVVALVVVGSSPITHPIENYRPLRNSKRIYRNGLFICTPLAQPDRSSEGVVFNSAVQSISQPLPPCAAPPFRHRTKSVFRPCAPRRWREAIPARVGHAYKPALERS